MPRPLLIAAATLAGAIALTPIGMFACADRRAREPAPVRSDVQASMIASQPAHNIQPDIAPPASMAAPSAPSGLPAPPPLASTATPPPPSATTGVATETAPRIAYTYGYRFRLPADGIAALQERHLAYCQELGEARCRVVAMHRGAPAAPAGNQPQPAAASLQLQVIAPLAPRFGDALTASAGRAGSRTPDRTITAADVSRQMVDSEARIRTRETLIRRLSALLETRTGNLDQAMQAERAINQAQEELDAARAWLAEMRGRVFMSRFELVYEASAPAAPPPEEAGPAFARVGETAWRSIAALLLVIGIAAPWLAIACGAWWAFRRWRLAVSLPL